MRLLPPCLPSKGGEMLIVVYGILLILVFLIGTCMVVTGSEYADRPLFLFGIALMVTAAVGLIFH